MKNVERILQEMCQCTPLENIKRKYRSQSQIYNAFRVFLPEVEKRIRERQDELSSLDSQRTALQQQVESLTVQASELKGRMEIEEGDHKSWIEKFEERQNQLQQELNGLERDIEEKRCELDRVNGELSELTKIGVTTGTVASIHGMELESGEDIIERVKTVKDYIAVQKEVKVLAERKTSLEEEKEGLEREKVNLTSEIQTQKNLVDEFKIKTQTFKEAVSITTSFLLSGYKTIDLKRLKDSLDLLGVKGDPSLSIDRLVSGLENVKTLTGLVEEIKKSRKELETLEANIAEAKGELKTLRDTVIKAMDEAKEKVVSQILSVNNATAIKIKETAENSIAKTDETWKENINQVKNAGETAVSIIKNLTDNAEKTLKSLNKQAETTFIEASKTSTEIVQTIETETYRALNRFNDHVSTATAKFKQDFEEWGNIRERVGEYKQILQYAVLLLGILETPEALRKVPSSIVKQLMRRIYVWTSMMLPNETMTPSENIHDKEWHLSTFTGYKLPVVFEWCMEELEKRFREEA